MIDERIICAGFGGQGIMIIGKFLANLAMSNGHNVTWMPSYGAEVRGGTAHSMVRISGKNIPTPLISNPTTLIAMNGPSIAKFMGKIKTGGLAIINTSMADDIPERPDIKTVRIPLSRLAAELGNIKCANMVALGVFVGVKKMFSVKDVIGEIEKALGNKKDLIELNKKAIELGYKEAQIGADKADEHR